MLPFIVVLAVFAPSGQQAAGAQSPESREAERAKAEIVHLEDRWLKAIEEVSVGVLGKILARRLPASGARSRSVRYENPVA